jgi:non-heme chloroperoxidase
MTTLLADDGVRLDYTEYGDPAGRPVVLLAGFKAPATTWFYQVPALAKAGYRVLAVDIRGHGLAERPASVDMGRRGLDVRDVLEGLDLAHVILVGGSMGANTIWSVVAQCGTERLAAAVTVDQTPKMLNTYDWLHGFYGYNLANRDTYFAERIPDTGMGTPIAKRGMRLVRLLRAMKRMSRVPWNFGGGPMIIRLRSRSHHDGRHRHPARRHAAGGRLAVLAGAGGR